MKIYIAGPMTGLPEFNYPAFRSAASALRLAGHEVFDPSENPKPKCGSWRGYMQMAIPQVIHAEIVVMLPGWELSKGALIERNLAFDLNIPVFTYPQFFDPVRYQNVLVKQAEKITIFNAPDIEILDLIELAYNATTDQVIDRFSTMDFPALRAAQ